MKKEVKKLMSKLESKECELQRYKEIVEKYKKQNAKKDETIRNLEEK